MRKRQINVIGCILVWSLAVLFGPGLPGEEVDSSLPRWRDWPNWRGPTCSGSGLDCGQDLGGELRSRKPVWTSEEEMTGTHQNGKRFDGGELGSWGKFGEECWAFSTFSIVDRRLYFYHPEGYGKATERSRRILREKDGKMSRPKEGIPDLILDHCARVRGSDVYMCLDAVTGRTLWKSKLEGRSVNHRFVRPECYSPQNVPCWGDGRLFGLGFSRRVQAMDAVTGEPLWENDAGPAAWFINYMYIDICENSRYAAKRGRHGPDWQFNTCAIVADQAVVCHSRYRSKQHAARHPHSGTGLIGLDVRSGRILWRLDDGLLASNVSPTRWTTRTGKDYIIIQGKGKVLCLEPMTGKQVWAIDGPWPRSQAPAQPVSNDHLVVVSREDVRCYKLSPEAATLVWTLPDAYRKLGCPVIHQGKVVMGSKTVDLFTGKVLADTGNVMPQHSYIAADGFVMSEKRKMCRIGEEEVQAIGNKVPELGGLANSYGEASVVMGRLFIRGNRRWACFDLRKDPSISDRYSTPVAPEHAVSVTSEHAAVKALGSPFWTERKAATDAIGSYTPDMCIDLARLVIEAPYPTAKSAATVLCGMGSRAKDAAALLASAVPDCARQGGYGRLLLLTKAVSAIDPAAITPAIVADLAALLSVNDDLTRFRACRAVEEIGPAAFGAVPSLIGLLQSADTYSFRWAALALASIGSVAGQDAIAELCSHLNSKTPAIVVYSLVALAKMDGPLPEAAVDQMLIWAFDYEAAAQHAPVVDIVPFEPELSRVHYVSFLAGRCLSRRPQQSLDKVMLHFTDAVASKLVKGKLRPGQATVMHYRVLGEMGSLAEPALAMMKQYRNSLPRETKMRGMDGDFATFWLNKIKAGAGDIVDEETK